MHTSFILPLLNNPLSFLPVLLLAGFYLTTAFMSYGYTVLVDVPSNMFNIDKAHSGAQIDFRYKAILNI